MANTFSVENLKKTIGYYYLVSYCPPERVNELKEMCRPLRENLTQQAGMSMEDYFSAVIPEVCSRIVAFHQNSRYPDQGIVDALARAAQGADGSPAKVGAFQAQMAEVAELPERAKADNRLHRKKGCRFCEKPCYYGYFTLVSDPDYPHLLQMLQAENEKAEDERNPLRVLWSFASGHIWRTLGIQQRVASVQHLGNLAYCLLLLGMAKSRFALPEVQIKAFQEANQRFIQRYSH